MASTNEELASALKMFSRFFDLIHQPLAVINERGEYVYYNRKARIWTGTVLNKRWVNICWMSTPV